MAPDPKPRLPPRYTEAPFPPYRFLPGRAPHPRRSPAGHSYREPEPVAPQWGPHDWVALTPWLRAVDLFNNGYWWECHEQLEALWKSAGKSLTHARFVRGVIHIAAAALHREIGRTASAAKQARAGLLAIEEAATESGGGAYMGLDARGWAIELRAWIENEMLSGPPRLLLHH